MDFKTVLVVLGLFMCCSTALGDTRKLNIAFLDLHFK